MVEKESKVQGYKMKEKSSEEKQQPEEGHEKKKLVEELKALLESLLKDFSREIRAVWAFQLEKKIMLYILISDSAEKDVYAAILKKQAESIKMEIRKLSEYFYNIMQNKEEYFLEIQKSAVIYDPSGIVRPIKTIIEEGRIKKTKESLMHLVVEVGQKMQNIKDIKIDVLSVLYGAAIEAAQAPLLLRGYSLLIPSTIPKMLNLFLKEKEISKNSISDFNDIYNAYKDYEHGRIKDINGKKLELLIKKADKFVDDMQHLARRLMKKAA